MQETSLGYMSVHLEVCKVLVQGLKDLGLMKGNVEEAVAAGAHALFLPHGLGHIDVYKRQTLHLGKNPVSDYCNRYYLAHLVL